VVTDDAPVSERALMGVVKHAVKTSAGTCGD